jgi:ribonucleoside-triphosphate reductase
MPFERLRRITGYLVGTLDRWNDGKKAEERDRVKHNVDCDCAPSNVEGVYTVEEKTEREVEKMHADKALGKE